MLFTGEIIKGAKMQVHVSKRKWGKNLKGLLKNPMGVHQLAGALSERESKWLMYNYIRLIKIAKAPRSGIEVYPDLSGLRSGKLLHSENHFFNKPLKADPCISWGLA
jgi:hypothetical protein